VSSRAARSLLVLAVLAVLVVGAVLVLTRWRVLPWVPDADVAAPADPPPAAAALPAVGEPEDVATGLAVPWGLAFLPDGRALVGERPTGRVLVVEPGQEPVDVGSVPGVAADGEGGLLGLALSPDFAQDRLVYAYLTTDVDNRVVTVSFDGTRLGRSTAVLTGIPRASYHDGGRLLFDPDGMLLVTTGDAGDPELAQQVDSLAGKILRMAPDGSVPADNPFPGSLVWSLGHRNVQGLAFDDEGRLWATEFGSSAYDEVNLIEAGGNYGWPMVEGVGGRPDLVDPQVTWPTSEASPSGLAWVDGVLYMSALRGERLWQIPVQGGVASRPTATLEGELGRIRTVTVAPDGTLWLTTSNTDGRGDPRPGDDRVVRLPVR
jgi:glucose/arabinose dehydrogenase